MMKKKTKSRIKRRTPKKNKADLRLSQFIKGSAGSGSVFTGTGKDILINQSAFFEF